MPRGIILPVVIVLGSSACAIPDSQSTLPPASVFEHRVSAVDVRVFWNCSQPEPNVLQVDGVVQNIGGPRVQFAEVEIVAVDASGRSVHSASSAVRDILIQTNQSSPFLVQLRTLGNEVRFDMFYRYRVRGAFGMGATEQRQVQNMARDVCSLTR